ncbi:MAG: hypothetical protein B6U95_09850 [Thermofilum sp. ex4484_82]|nr:MAG: hypothetical protein B6U95_09850 [Thermofilum sp. ex4484_82]OYT35640.1 MAG: hypothetical protein B6U96_09860 [Archaeoglobales archaeon ex4484_92]
MVVPLVVFCFDFSKKPKRMDDFRKWARRKTIFYRKLYGADIKNVKRRVDGSFLEADTIPCLRLDRSVFAVRPEDFRKVISFFEGFPEVEYRFFLGIFDEKEIRNDMISSSISKDSLEALEKSFREIIKIRK